MKIRYLALIIIVIFITNYCSKSNDLMNKRGDMKEVPVLVARVVQKSMPIQIKTIGLVEASLSVSVKSQVSGEIKKIHFKEGDEVREGSLLFSIDSEPYEAVLKKAQATLAKDRVLEAKAREDVERYADLAKKEYITKEQYNQIVSNAESLKEIVKADEAMVQSAQIDLDRCRIKAPISGITGEIKIKEGNLIRANDDKPLVVINKIHPVYVKFSLPEKELVNLMKYMKLGEIRVESVVPGYEDRKQTGKLFFIDNAVDSTTGTIQAKAIFDNKENVLWPGQYVDVIVILAIEPNALVIPSQAVQTSQDGDFVFVVNGNNAVEARKVNISREIGGEVVIAEGVKVNEIVVTDGQMQLVPGSKVKIKNAEVLKGE
jgi:multidrug efflux system membrane fusion protein